MRNAMRGSAGAIASAMAATLIACGGGETPATAPAADSNVALSQDPANQVPVIDSVALSVWEVKPGDVLTATVETHDPENHDVKLGYVWNIGDHRFPGGESFIEIPLTAKRGDVVRVSVTASDSFATSPPMEATTEVANSAPTWREISLEHAARVVSGSKLTIHAIADDHDGDELTLETRWFVNKRRVEASGAIFDTSGLRRGDVVHAVIVGDDGSLETPERATDAVVIDNSDPTFVSAPGTLSKDGRFEYEPKLADADGDRRFRFSLASAPPDMTIDRSFGVIRWLATERQQGSHTIEIVAEDLYGGEARQQFDLTVRVSEADAPPASHGSGGSKKRGT